MLLPATASANAAVPGPFLTYPAAWLMFVPVVGIELLIARAILGRPLREVQAAVWLGNLTSSLIGIPLSFLLFLALHMVLDWQMLAMPFVVVEGSPLWIVLLGWLVPCFPLSVWIEQKIARRMWRCDASRARRWAWLANSASYGFLLITGLILAFVFS